MANNPRCRRCGGNLLPGEDIYSRYMSCMQCGTTEEPSGLGSLDQELAATLAPYREKLGLAASRR